MNEDGFIAFSSVGLKSRVEEWTQLPPEEGDTGSELAVLPEACDWLPPVSVSFLSVFPFILGVALLSLRRKPRSPDILIRP